MVSIMPGIEAAAPERTETKSGLFLPPNCLPVVFSSLAMFSRICADRTAGHFLPRS